MAMRPRIARKLSLKPGFHRPMNHADERHKTADLLDFENIFSWCQRFVESADLY